MITVINKHKIDDNTIPACDLKHGQVAELVGLQTGNYVRRLGASGNWIIVGVTFNDWWGSPQNLPVRPLREGESVTVKYDNN